MSIADDLAARIADGDVIVLDGGMGTELQARGVPMDNEAWSGVANLDYPDVVREIHEAYIRAGADVIIANTYAAARLPLERAGYGDRVAESNRRAVELALEARENAAERPVAIAGSMSLAAATDVVLRGRPGPEGEELLAAYREQATAQKEAGIDVMALEMICAAGYGHAAIQAAAEAGLPVWLGISVDAAAEGERVQTLGRQGVYLDDLLDELLGPQIAAVTIMHSLVDAVNPALEVIRERWSGPMGAYPHVGDYKPPEWIFGDITPEAFAAEAQQWVERGAQLVGGCCGLRPEHIRALRDTLPAHVRA